MIINGKEEFIKKITISDFDNLSEIIRGKTDFCPDIRKEFIFRGMSDENYNLCPSSLRKNSKLNDFVDEDFKVKLNGDVLDKTNNKIANTSLAEYQYLKEINTLVKFFENGDKLGLKIPINQDIRDLILHRDKERKIKHLWPDENYFELISLAQHYGIPTRALDWSYDYKVALYFAVKDILTKNNPKNGILWAFNYKSCEIDCLKDFKKPYAIKYYRPEYNSNPNLNAQKGLFTFIINNLDYITHESLDKLIDDNLSENHEIKKLNGNIKIFYKFIIPKTIKPDLLNELYLDGYSEEHLFPSYDGITKSIENRVKLDKILLNR